MNKQKASILTALLIFTMLGTGFVVQTQQNSVIAAQPVIPTLPKKIRAILQRNFRSVCDIPIKGIARCHARVVTNDVGNPLGSSNPYSTSYGPVQFHTAYNLPCTPGGGKQSACDTPSSFGSQTIAIVDAYHSPNIENDLNTYSDNYSIPRCTTLNGCLNIVNQTGGATLPTTVNSGWTLETSLDVEVAHAICQTCKILLVEANSSSYADLTTAVNYAASLGVTAISNSYGSSEWSGETAFDTAYNHPGIAVTVSSGDSGYGADYPAASPNVIAVGGTTLQLFTDNTYHQEIVWNGAGSGCSSYELANTWQKNLTNWSLTKCATRRAIADVSADADPNTGAAVYDSTPYNGSTGWYQVGGTSLAAPIVAGIYALAGGVSANTNAASLLYTNFSAGNSNDIINGTNGNCGSIMCNAGTFYDGPSGLGSFNGINAFTQTPTLTPTPTSADSIPPKVAITAPLNGSTVPRRTYITVKATASDNIGVTKVDLYRDNILVCTDTIAPYTCSVMYTDQSSGLKVTYKATAYDAAGNSSSNTVSAKVR